ncbi:MAG: ribonuclease P protein component [Proteobacteria bacterium]|nr:ribonuclease P protein component [Pseudomonadota bacterium]MBI3499684.1 ribonuclease P protein component [Pseudomonadota bacterium]
MAVARLKRRPQFLAVAASGLKVATPGVIVQALRRGDKDAPRLGLTASRKIGGAVERNRARRRLRAAAEAVIPLAGGAGHDYVLIARRATLTRPFALMVEELGRALRRLDAASRPLEDR